MMFQFAHIAPITLPLEDPILKFLLILIIILAAPLLLNKLKIPYLLGLIIAGAVIGPHGLNLVLRDSSIILSGTAGLLYIMFLSGLDMDTSDFKKSGWRSLVFGLYTFCVPLALGILAGYYIMGFSIYSSILLAGLFASQTLIAYPIVSKLGISRDKAVTIAVGGTVITDTLALLLLTVIVGMATGNVDESFWWRLSASVLLCIGIILFLFPLLAHWFTPETYGIYMGSTMHEVAQVVAAGHAVSPDAENAAVIAKMLRVMMLAPFLLFLAARVKQLTPAGNGEKSKITIPWFAIMFILVAVFNSFHLLPKAVVDMLVTLDTVLLAMAMAALGVTTHVSALKKAGAKPLLMALMLFVWLIVGGGVINVAIHSLMA